MNNQPKPSPFIFRIASNCAYLYGLGWFIGGILLFGGNVVIYEISQAVKDKVALTSGPGNLTLSEGWWMIWASYFIFTLSDFALIIVVVGINYLYGDKDVRMQLITLTVIIWMTIALIVDCLLMGASWIIGPRFGTGVDPATIGTVFIEYDHYVNNLIRWPVRGMYVFVGGSMILLGRILAKRPQLKGVSRACQFLGIAMWIEVLTFAITVVFGSSPIHLPAYYLMFFAAAPTWGIVIGNALRNNTNSLLAKG